VFLTASEGANLKDIITENKECMMELFEVLEAWCDKPPRGRCLPLNLWTLECFKYIARYVGVLVEVDEATRDWERIEYARLKINIQASDKAEVSKGIKINEKVYWITVEEECHDTCSSNWNRWWSRRYAFLTLIRLRFLRWMT